MFIMRNAWVPVLAVFLLSAAAPAAENQTTWRERESQGSGMVREDVSEEIAFGREVAARIIGRFGLSPNQDAARYVNLVGRAVAMNTNRPEIEFRFAVLNTDEVNAYAAPGGYVFVTRGALLRMQDEAELAGVIAHEIAHVALKHIVKELNIHGAENAPTAGLARLIGGSTEAARVAFSQAVEKTLDILFKNGYKREDEIQADKAAASYAAITGYDPLALSRYLERIGPLKAGTEVLDKTHPTFGDRVAWIKATVQEEGMEGAAYKNSRDRFTEVQKKLK